MTQSRWLDTEDKTHQTPSNYRDLLTEATVQIRKLRRQLDDAEQQQYEPIAIVGMSCRFPGGANTPEAYWKLLRNGVDAVSEIPSQRWPVETYYDKNPDIPGKMYTRQGSFIDNIDQFDPQFFGISPREARSLDPQQRLLLETSYTALENAGLPPFDLQGSATGVFIGLSFDDYAQRSVRSGDLSRIDAFSSLGNTRSIAAGRIAYVFGFQGPTMQLDTTCSSSLLAVHLACQSLRNGESNLALAGGVSLMLSPEATIGFCKLKALAPDGRCKTFDASADGYGRGEGCGVVVLKRLSDAIANQDNILALVKGSAANHDGVSNGLTAPNGSAQTAVIRQALSNAKLSGQQIQYVEAHGTGTSLGDPIELLALNQALNQALGEARSTPLLVGTVKTNFGHLEAAAGVAGLMKVVLSLQHQQVPPHLHFSTPNPHIPWQRLAIEIPQKLTPWPTTDEPKRAGLSGFGMSGTNVHLVIEEAIDETISETVTAEELSVVDRPGHLLTLSAQSEKALDELARQYRNWVATTTADLADICFTAGVGRSHFNHRVALVAADKTQLIHQLNGLLEQARPQQEHQALPKIAFLFTGQGAQYVGMGQQLYKTEAVFRDAMDRCAASLKREGINLLEIIYPDEQYLLSPAALNQTTNTQPALFAIAYALTELWASWGITPSYVLGHSVGEYGAACAAGVFSLEEGARLIAARGRLMQALPSGGGMFAVMASKAQVSSLLESADSLGGPSNIAVEIAAENGPENTVISGNLEALAIAISYLEAQGIKTKQLQVSHAFHSQLMEPMLTDFEQVARSIQYYPPEIDFVSSMTGEAVDDAQAEDWASYWCEQIRQPIQFAKAVQTLEQEKCTCFVEIGPKPTLLAMARACLPSLDARWLPSLSCPKTRSSSRRLSQGSLKRASQQSGQQTGQQPGQKSDWETMLSSLCELYEAGVTVDWAGFDRAYPRKIVALPNYPFQRQRYWLPAEGNLTNPLSNRRASSTNQQLAEIHPLLGQSLSIAGDRTHCFEAQLAPSSSSQGLLQWADHQVFGQALMPAAAYVEIGLAAGKEIFADQPYCLESVELQQGLWLDLETDACLQTQLTREADGRYQLEIYSRQNSEISAVGGAWVRHAMAKVKRKPETVSSEHSTEISVSELQKQLPKTSSAEEIYSQFSQRGISYGTSFQTIQTVCSRSDYQEVLAQVELADNSSVQSSSRATSFLFHPVLLDAGLQVAGITLSADMGSYLPVASKAFDLLHPVPDDEIWVYAKVRSSSLEKTTIDVRWVAAASDQVFAEMKGLTLQAVDAHQVLNNPSSAQQVQWLHQIDWKPQALSQTSAEFLAAPTEVCDRIAPYFTQRIQIPEFQNYQALQPELNQLAIAYIHQAILEIGGAEVANDLQVASQHQSLFARCLAILAEKNAEIDENTNPQSTYQHLSQHYPSLRSELTLIKRCGENLAAALRGEIDPLSLLFPGGDLTDLSELYRSSAGPNVMNQLVCEVVRLTVSKSQQIGRPLRIVEIGAGTGGTTAHLVPQLLALDSPVEYLFTDISLRFVSAAKEAFQDFPFVDYALLDIEDEAQVKAFSQIGEGGFDIAIAANVLHATEDLQQTLTHVSQLLAPGGKLVLLEGTQPLAWVDLIFGLTPGWWRFTDTILRPNHPLISVKKWQTLLAKTGFETALAIEPNTKPENAAPALAQSVIIAQRPKNIETRWAVLGEAATADLMVSQLQADGQQADLFVVDNLLETETEQYDGVVFVLPESTDDTEHHLVERANSLYAQAIAIVQTLIKIPHSPRLYFVSTQADAASQLIQSGLWGLLQTAQLEHSALRSSYLQVETPTQLVRELLAKSPETQVVYRDGQRRVARIENYSPDSLALTQSVPTQLVTDASKTIAGLRWQPNPRKKPGELEVEIRVSATGLNFRDVLIAMGEYPEAAPLGCECVGEIVSVGSGAGDLAARGLSIGTQVMAIAPHSFAQYVTINRDLVVPIPETTDLLAAATLPVAFTTAYYSLYQLAELKAGEKVLIHSAAGGVGQAAVQIAQQVGAEIFATASPHKWDLLKEMGITHIMNSRKLTFADEIMSATAGSGVDVVLNALPGEFRAKSLEALGEGGRFVEIGKGDGLSVEEMAEIRPDASHYTVDISSLCEQQPQQIQSMLKHVATAIECDRWQSLPFTAFNQTETIQAFRTLQQAKSTGKIVLTQSENVQSEAIQSETTELPIPLQAEATYLITGGCGGLGLVMTEWMAQQGAKRFVLLSRHQPTDTVQARLSQFREDGFTVDVVLADVTDIAAMRRAIAHIETSKNYPLKGVIHAAGVLDDSLIQQLTPEKLKTVLAPKVSGAWNLHQLTQENSELDFFVLFSSAAALLGSPGQANHATANAFLDGLARYRQQLGLPALSINWGAWSEVGSALKYQSDQSTLESFPGVGVIAPNEGLAQLEKIWGANAVGSEAMQKETTQIGVVPVDWQTFFRQGLGKHLHQTQPFFERVSTKDSNPFSDDQNKSNLDAPNTAFLETLKNSPDDQKRELLERFVCERIGQTLGFSPDEINRQAGFFDLGMDSLTALELKNSLQADLELSLPSTLAFDYPTVDALVTYLTAQFVEEPLLAEDAEQETVDPEDSTLLSENDLGAEMDRKLADIDRLLEEDSTS
ncbi:MAG: SDR family NAD(P)-dependent oxidoreductase [Cyanobacteria bacterium J06621_11]